MYELHEGSGIHLCSTYTLAEALRDLWQRVHMATQTAIHSSAPATTELTLRNRNQSPEILITVRVSPAPIEVRD